MSDWFIVSNRLPLTFEKNKLKKGSGGLITAITGIKGKNRLSWMGAVPQVNDQTTLVFQEALTELKDPIKFYPVFIDSKLYDHFYNNFCNDVLWPLLHYETNFVKFNQPAWDSYVHVNQIFASAIDKTVKDDDTKPSKKLWGRQTSGSSLATCRSTPVASHHRLPTHNYLLGLV